MGCHFTKAARAQSSQGVAPRPTPPAGNQDGEVLPPALAGEMVTWRSGDDLFLSCSINSSQLAAAASGVPMPSHAQARRGALGVGRRKISSGSMSQGSSTGALSTRDLNASLGSVAVPVGHSRHGSVGSSMHTLPEVPGGDHEPSKRSVLPEVMSGSRRALSLLAPAAWAAEQAGDPMPEPPDSSVKAESVALAVGEADHGHDAKATQADLPRRGVDKDTQTLHGRVGDAPTTDSTPPAAGEGGAASRPQLTDHPGSGGGASEPGTAGPGPDPSSHGSGPLSGQRMVMGRMRAPRGPSDGTAAAKSASPTEALRAATLSPRGDGGAGAASLRPPMISTRPHPHARRSSSGGTATSARSHVSDPAVAQTVMRALSLHPEPSTAAANPPPGFVARRASFRWISDTMWEVDFHDDGASGSDTPGTNASITARSGRAAARAQRRRGAADGVFSPDSHRSSGTRASLAIERYEESQRRTAVRFRATPAALNRMLSGGSTMSSSPASSADLSGSGSFDDFGSYGSPVSDLDWSSGLLFATSVTGSSIGGGDFGGPGTLLHGVLYARRRGSTVPDLELGRQGSIPEEGDLSAQES